jgi:hypothetical protein
MSCDADPLPGRGQGEDRFFAHGTLREMSTIYPNTNFRHSNPSASPLGELHSIPRNLKIE